MKKFEVARPNHTGSARFDAKRQKTQKPEVPPRHFRQEGVALDQAPARCQTVHLKVRWATHPLLVKQGRLLAMRHHPQKGLQVLVKQEKGHWLNLTNVLTENQARRWLIEGF